jgi:hypothetical protein
MGAAVNAFTLRAARGQSPAMTASAIAAAPTISWRFDPLTVMNES